MKKIRLKWNRKLSPGYLFDSQFEERKIYEYVNNFIHSRFLNEKLEELYQFINEILGDKIIVTLLQEHDPKIVLHKNFTHWIEDEELHEHISPKRLTRFLKEAISPWTLKKVADLSNINSDIEKRLINLQQTFKLTAEELDIVIFTYLKSSNQKLDDCVGYNGDIITFSRFSTFKSYGHILLGLSRNSFIKALNNKTLVQSDIIDLDDIDLRSWCMDYLSGIASDDLSHEFFNIDNKESLCIDDFDIPENELLVLDTLIKSRDKQNILLYGESGTGKTSFAKSLAKGYKKELLTVKIPESDDQDDRLRYIYGASNLADQNNSLILVDEADEMLNSYKSFFFESKISKSWINNFLDNHDKKIIWITNRSSEIDASTMRRFSFTMEFQNFNPKTRLKVLKYELKKMNLDNYFNEKILNDLCQNYSVNASAIVDVINVLNIDRESDKEVALKKIQTILRNHEKAVSKKVMVSKKVKDFKNYSLKALNTSFELDKIISTIQKYNQKYENGLVKESLPISLLLYGLPGTGKSEFVYYLGHLLNKEILLKRSSDIQSKWVGETEKNIADAFREAHNDGKILFFDEADSFLFPRQMAHHSWERSFTNEILTQLESYEGIVFFATNEIDGLDHAALRRFKFKIEFRSLNPDGVLLCYNSMLKQLTAKGNRLSSKLIARLKNIRNLSPGDFTVVREQHLFLESSEITNQSLIDSLLNEASHKKKTQSKAGFKL